MYVFSLPIGVPAHNFVYNKTPMKNLLYILFFLFLEIQQGPMADDTIWNFVNDFLNGNISRSVFWEYAKFKHPTHQISFHSIKALACLEFERSEEIHEQEL